MRKKKRITTTSNRRRRRDRSWKVLHEINVGKITAITGGPVRARRSRTETVEALPRATAGAGRER